jgi:hypothetical protein
MLAEETPGIDERARRVAAFESLVRRGAPGDLVERAVRAVVAAVEAGHGSATSLEGEIQALRLVLSRVLAVDALDSEPREAAQTVTRLVDTIVRAVRAQQGMAVADVDVVQAAIRRALREEDAGGFDIDRETDGEA